MTNYFVFLLALCSSPLILFAQKAKVLKVCLSAYPLSSSTLAGVDSFQIMHSAPLNTKIKRPQEFITQLENELGKRDTIPLQLFRHNYVRFFFNVYRKKGGTNSIYLAQGSSLLYRRKLYKLDNSLKQFIREFIPDKDEYLPVQASKL